MIPVLNILFSIGSGLLSGGLSTYILKLIFEEKIKQSIAHQYKLKFEEWKKEIDKEIEKYKSEMRLAEFVYPKKLDALKALYSLEQNVLPDKNYPDMDWYEACNNIALSLASYQNSLKNILKKYSNVLSQKIIDILDRAAFYCGEGKFEIYNHNPTQYGNQCADNFYNKLGEAINTLKKELEIKT